jgi:hypothetical protein
MSQVNLIEARGVSKIYQSKDGPVESLKPLDFAIAKASSSRSSALRVAARARC